MFEISKVFNFFTHKVKSKKNKLINKVTKSAKYENIHETKKHHFFWEVDKEIAYSERPGYPNENIDLVDLQKVVDEWKDNGINSIICLLTKKELDLFYSSVNGDLEQFYTNNGFQVFMQETHIDNIPENDIETIYQNYKKLQKPVLIHCSANKKRTEKVLEYIHNSSDLNKGLWI